MGKRTRRGGRGGRGTIMNPSNEKPNSWGEVVKRGRKRGRFSIPIEVRQIN